MNPILKAHYKKITSKGGKARWKGKTKEERSEAMKAIRKQGKQKSVEDKPVE